jgi:hypothetical protein
LKAKNSSVSTQQLKRLRKSCHLKKVINKAQVMNLKEWNSMKHHAKMDDLSEFPGLQRSLTWKGSGQEWTRQDTQRVSLTQEGNDKTHIERARRLMTNWQKFYFSQQALYKRARDLNIKTLWPSYNLSVFAILYCLLPVSLTKYKLLFSQGKPFSVPSHHDRGMVHLQIPTLSECC